MEIPPYRSGSSSEITGTLLPRSGRAITNSQPGKSSQKQIQKYFLSLYPFAFAISKNCFATYQEIKRTTNTPIKTPNKYAIFSFLSIKKCANRSRRTEKRKLRLSPNKKQRTGELSTIAAEFAFLLNSYSYREMGIKTKLPTVKQRVSPRIAIDFCLARLFYHAYPKISIQIFQNPPFYLYCWYAILLKMHFQKRERLQWQRDKAVLQIKV